MAAVFLKNDEIMQIKFFTIPITGVNDYSEELNSFLLHHKIIEVEKQLIQTATGAYWCIYINYTSGVGTSDNKPNEKIDYMKELDAETFAKFSKLRSIRKELSVEEGISAYIICTDAELAEIAKLPELTLNKLKTVKGMGDKKMEKFGEKIIQRFNKLTNEKDKKPIE